MADPSEFPFLLRPTGCFDAEIGSLTPAHAGAPLAIAEQRGNCIATIAALAGETEALQVKIWTSFGTDLPRGSGVSTTGDVSLIGIAPDCWLGVRENPPPGSTERLIADLAGTASVSVQAGAYGLLRITGGAARKLLSRGIYIDLDPARFTVGSAAVTSIAHIGIILWQPRTHDSFDLAVPRSYACSFWHWLESTSDAMDVRLARS